MKKIPLLLLSFCTSYVFAQSATDFDTIKLSNAADCKAAEHYVLEASNYLFTTPFDKNDLQRLKSLKFIIAWMSATPDYKFSLDGVADKIMKGNDDLLGQYMGAMTKYVLENKSLSADPKLVKLNSVTTVLKYCEDPSNNHL